MTPEAPEAPTDESNEHRTLERMKELDHVHRNRLRSVARVTVSLRFLANALSRLRHGTAPVRVESVAHPAAGAMALTFVGHGTVMFTTPRARVLTDPQLEDRLWALPRVRAAGIAKEDLADVGLVMISHAHRDHLSRRSLKRLPRSATIVVPPRCADLVSDLGFEQVVELGVGRRLSFQDLEIVAVPARHTGTRGPAAFRHRGVVGYVVRSQGGTAYFAGDTAYFSGFVEIGARYRPDVVCLPIGGYEPAPFRREHMSPLDAIYAFEDLGASVLLPICHSSFLLSYESMDEPLTWLNALAQERKLTERLMILQHGGTYVMHRSQ